MCIYVCILKGLGGYIHVHVCVYIEGSGTNAKSII